MKPVCAKEIRIHARMPLGLGKRWNVFYLVPSLNHSSGGGMPQEPDNKADESVYSQLLQVCLERLMPVPLDHLGRSEYSLAIRVRTARSMSVAIVYQ